MAIPDFLNKKEENHKKSFKAKNDFRQKCVRVLNEIKKFNEEKYQELSKIFHAKFDKLNIQKKILLGFYGQLVNELNDLKGKAGPMIKKKISKVAKKVAKKVSKKTTKKAPAKKKVVKKKTAKKVAKKKVTKKKKTAKKKTAKKAVSKKKVTKKKATKKKTTKKR